MVPWDLLWYGLRRLVITSNVRQLVVFILIGWRLVFGIIINRDGRDPHTLRCHHGSDGIIKLFLIT